MIAPLLAALPGPVAAAATPPAAGSPFTGYGAAPFGIRWEKALTLFPTAEQLPDNKSVGSPTIGGPFVHRLLLTGQRLDGLAKPVTVELRFWKKKLWTVQVYFGDNGDQDVLAMLTKRLGPAESGDAGNPLWIRGDVQTTASAKQGWFGSTDLTLSADAQAWFKKLMRGEWKKASQAELDEMEGRPPAPAAP